MNLSRRGLAALTVAILAATAGCQGSSLAPPAPPADITIGLLLPMTGPYKAIGDDMKRGWDLYIKKSGGTLGGHKINVVVADEGDGRSAARSAIDKLLKSDQATVIVGTANADAVETIAGPVTQAQVPFIGVGGRPSTLSDLTYIWHTSFQSTDYGKAIGGHLAATAGGPVYVIGPDYRGGHDQIEGFVNAFTAAGGTLANPGGQPAYTPWPATDNYAPWLAKIKDVNGGKGPAAVYTFAAGAPAVAFVKQYREFGLGTIPLYGAGFLTEGAVLQAQAAAADGIHTCAPYSPDLDNTMNKTFAADIVREYQTPPNIYHVTSFDAAALLDAALKLAGPTVTAQQLNTAIAKLSTVDSPRGTWTLSPSTHTPVQPWYLRKVQPSGAGRANVVVRELGTFGG